MQAVAPPEQESPVAGPPEGLYGRIQPYLFRLDPEGAHHLTVRAATWAQRVMPGTVASWFAYENDTLRQKLWGLDFDNPVGLAAGFDKNARLIPFWKTLGFGFAEIGSVTARPSKGNPRPRLFRLPEDRALINRMGLNNKGAERIARKLRTTIKPAHLQLGINLAKTHDPSILGEAGIEDFRTSFRVMAPFAGYLVLNISCPNTSEGKTFEEPEILDRLLQAIFQERTALALDVPVLLKLSPPLSERVRFDSLTEEIVNIADRHGIEGYVASNTAGERDGLQTSPEVLASIGRGGLSGKPIESRSTRLVRYLYEKTGGKVPIIGVGGISSAEGAYAKIRAGASLIQVYTGLIYEGPDLIRSIKKGLVEFMERDGFRSISQAVGADLR